MLQPAPVTTDARAANNPLQGNAGSAIRLLRCTAQTDADDMMFLRRTVMPVRTTASNETSPQHPLPNGATPPPVEQRPTPIVSSRPPSPPETTLEDNPNQRVQTVRVSSSIGWWLLSPLLWMFNFVFVDNIVPTDDFFMRVRKASVGGMLLAFLGQCINIVELWRSSPLPLALFTLFSIFIPMAVTNGFGFVYCKVTKKTPDWLFGTIMITATACRCFLATTSRAYDMGAASAALVVLTLCSRMPLAVEVAVILLTMIGLIINTVNLQSTGDVLLMFPGSSMQTVDLMKHLVGSRSAFLFSTVFFFVMARHFYNILAAKDSAVKVSRELAERLQKYDTAGAWNILRGRHEVDPDLLKAFEGIVANLERYRPFLPNYVLDTSDVALRFTSLEDISLDAPATSPPTDDSLSFVSAVRRTPAVQANNRRLPLAAGGGGGGISALVSFVPIASEGMTGQDSSFGAGCTTDNSTSMEHHGDDGHHAPPMSAGDSFGTVPVTPDNEAIKCRNSPRGYIGLKRSIHHPFAVAALNSDGGDTDDDRRCQHAGGIGKNAGGIGKENKHDEDDHHVFHHSKHITTVMNSSLLLLPRMHSSTSTVSVCLMSMLSDENARIEFGAATLNDTFIKIVNDAALTTGASLHSFLGDQLIATWNGARQISKPEVRACQFPLRIRAVIASDPTLRSFYRLASMVTTRQAECCFAGDSRLRLFACSSPELWRHAYAGLRSVESQHVSVTDWATKEVAQAEIVFRAGAFLSPASSGEAITRQVHRPESVLQSRCLYELVQERLTDLSLDGGRGDADWMYVKQQQAKDPNEQLIDAMELCALGRANEGMKRIAQLQLVPEHQPSILSDVMRWYDERLDVYRLMNSSPL